jgi:hypothetical protein
VILVTLAVVAAALGEVPGPCSRDHPGVRVFRSQNGVVASPGMIFHLGLASAALPHVSCPAGAEGVGVEPVSLIVGALAAGVGETGKAAVKDAYEALKRLISARFTGKPAAQTALAEHADDPDTWDKPLTRAITESGAATDTQVIAAAQELMRLLDETGTAAGKYRVDLRGAQGVQVGDRNEQVNLFGTPPGRP